MSAVMQSGLCTPDLGGGANTKQVTDAWSPAFSRRVERVRIQTSSLQNGLPQKIRGGIMSKKTERTVAQGRRKLIKQTATLTVAAAAAQFGFPAILRAQSDTIRIGHITPRTGFLGQVGEYGYKGALLAVEEAMRRAAYSGAKSR